MRLKMLPEVEDMVMRKPHYSILCPYGGRCGTEVPRLTMVNVSIFVLDELG